ncbi:MAG: GDSL-type esterase/lipase family protein, partial [Candidatus Omnitrophica bacterium]|nr:GDSL-type esterase/lipase family protein [Candidatus Omnitrophota bacterium]
EVSIKTYQKLVRNVPFSRSTLDYYDRELGWKGKKVFGDRFTAKYKIFFIGVSFTEGCGVDEESMYCNIIAKNLNAEAFVYGGSGYGTLQEYMVLNRYIDEIKPDLIVLQVCTNDFINNLWELESASFYNNDLMTRPYFVDGKIEYRFPKFPWKLRMFLYSHSRFTYLLGHSLDRFLAELCKKGFLHSVDEDIIKKGMDFDNFKKAVNATDTLIKKMKERAGQVPIVAFTVNDHRNFLEQFRRIFQENGIEFIEDVPKEIRKKSIKGIKVYLEKQWHWSESGHRICGDLLSKRLQQKVINKDKRLLLQ